MRNFFVTISVAAGLLLAPLLVPATAGAVNVFEGACSNNSADGNAVCANKNDGDEMIKLVIDLLFYVVGIIAVVVIIVGGIKFITADGDAGKIKSARETILYAVVGLVVALLAYSIVQFVVGRF